MPLFTLRCALELLRLADAGQTHTPSRQAMNLSTTTRTLRAERATGRGGPRRGRRPNVESLEPRCLLTPFGVGGDPIVNPADFRITTFTQGLNYPHGMTTLSD